MSQQNLSISVLMTTYHGNRAEYLEAALRSIAAQTLLPQEIVLVLDGQVDARQESVVGDFTRQRGAMGFKIVRLAENVGLAKALNVGLQSCECTWVARMDSDDIAEPERLEIQWQYLSRHSEVDVLAAWHRECDADGTLSARIKNTPPDHAAIVSALKWRNIISHPTIIFRKELVLRMGGYPTAVQLQEDYALYVRLAAAGARFAAVQKPLLRVRVTAAQFARRGGLAYIFSTEMKMRQRMFELGFCSLPFAIASGLIRSCFIASPGFIKPMFYRFVRTMRPS